MILGNDRTLVYGRVESPGMADVSRLLDATAAGNPQATAELLPLIYDELRRLATARMTTVRKFLGEDATGPHLDA
jgi:hypothetical protein